MKSLQSFIAESMKGKNGKLNLKRFKELKALMKDYDPKKYKRDPKLNKFFKKNIKESVNEEDLLDDFETWITDNIDSWIQSCDDEPADLKQIEIDLQRAEDYFWNNIDQFYDEFGYDDVDVEDEYGDKCSEIIQNYVESSLEYLADNYDYWDRRHEDW